MTDTITPATPTPWSTCSEATNEIAQALATAQAEFAAITKNKTVSIKSEKGASYKFSYADLAQIIEATRPALTKNGIALTWPCDDTYLFVMLSHTSGQFIRSRLRLPPYKDDLKSFGGWLTYQRRYLGSALLGIASEDDNDAMEQMQREEDAQAEKRQAATSRLDELKKKGLVKSAHDGKVLAPGESPLPEERNETPAPQPETKPEPVAEADQFAGVDGKLADLLRKASLTPAELKAYYVGKGHLPATVEPANLPADYITGLTKPENWKRAVVAMKGAK